MLFQYGLEPVIIRRILIGLKSILEKIYPSLILAETTGISDL